jgi:hypothetical protein
MSQVTHPQVKLTDRARAHTKLAIAGLLALLATIGVVLVLAIGSDSASDPATVIPVSAGYPVPDESRVAEAVGNQPSGSSESNIAAAVGNQRSGPDESAVAAAVAGQH